MFANVLLITTRSHPTVVSRERGILGALGRMHGLDHAELGDPRS